MDDPIEIVTGNPHVSAQIEARKRHGYGPIHLLRLGDKVVVSIMSHGEWVPVITESIDSNFSHIVEPLGIEETLKKR